MEFRILGEVQVATDGDLLALGGPKQRLLLAVLLCRPGQLVSVGQLVEALWGHRAPASAAANVRLYVHRLRRVLGVERLAGRAGGYALAIAPRQVDSHQFTELIERGSAELSAGAPLQARQYLHDALLKWRGRPFADLDTAPALREEAARLEELQLSALEHRIEADLRLGHHAAAVAELTTLVVANPLREGFHAQLMRALHYCSRRAEALEAYHTARNVLVREVGLEPGPELRNLQRAILVGDQGMQRASAMVDAPATSLAPQARPIIQSPNAVLPPQCVPRSVPPRDSHETIGNTETDAAPSAGTPASQRPPAAIPMQLPIDVRCFTGRTGALAALGALLTSADERPAVVAVSGTAGVGKTALAVHWAHQVAGRFPDGQLYVNLRGYDPDQPMTATEALAQFLAALGMAGTDIPPEVDERAARYRTQVAGKRMLIVLDNAATAEQVRPLLPGTATCPVVVTSRDSLAGLVARDGAQRLNLDLLPSADAIALLRRLIGPRADTEPEAAAALAEQCARLPLALRITAELAVSRPATPLAELVTELADQQPRLDLLDAGGDPHAAVATVFSWSIRHLPPDAADMFRRLGLHPGPEIDAYAAAALAHTSLPKARHLLVVLARAHLVNLTNAGRYAMHDLLRAYAANLAADDSDEHRRAALRRLFDYYLATAATAMNHLHPAEAHRRPQIPAPDLPAPDLTDPDTAHRWLNTERPTLAAAAAHTANNGWPTHAIRLSAILYRYLDGHHTDALTIHGNARDAARHAGDVAGQAQALLGLGAAHGKASRYSLAADLLEQALAMFREVEDRAGEAHALTTLGVIERRLGRYPLAAAYLEQALTLARNTGDRTREAHALTSLGIVKRRLGLYGLAVDHHEQALTLFRQLGHRTGEAAALNSLGGVEQRLGRHRRAAHHIEQALALFQQIGNQAGEAHARVNLGTLRTRCGEPGQAIEYHQQALTLFRDSGDRDGEAGALNGLGEAHHAAGQPADAVTHHTIALSIATDIGDRDQQAGAHLGLGHAHHTLADSARAHHHYELAIALYTELGVPDAHDVPTVHHPPPDST